MSDEHRHDRPVKATSRQPVARDAYQAAQEVGRVLSETLRQDLVAVYLHGSAVLGGFRWDRSDLDVLAVARRPLSDRQLGAIVQGLAQLAYPANGLEFSIMTAEAAARPSLPAPRFQLHQATDGWDRRGKVVDGRAREGDPDLVLHLAVCRDRGEALVGPSPKTSLGPVPDAVVLSAMRDELRWARQHAPLEYLVLTSARIWLYVETHRIGSKVEAGEWAARRYPQPGVILASLLRQGGAEALIPKEAADRLADHVERLAAPASA